jgi:hypothetical protein
MGSSAGIHNPLDTGIGEVLESYVVSGGPSEYRAASPRGKGTGLAARDKRLESAQPRASNVFNIGAWLNGERS